MSLSLHEEHPTHFVVSHPEKGEFKVAKSHLDDKTIEKIRKMPMVKKLACGGKVGYAEGGEVDDEAPLAGIAAPPPDETMADYSAEEAAPAPAEAPQMVSAAPPPSIDAPAGPPSPPIVAPTAPPNPNVGGAPGGGMMLTGAQMPQAPMPDVEGGYGNAFGQMEGGIKGQAAAASQASKEQVAAFEQFKTATAEAQKAHQASLQQNEAEHAQIVQDIKDQKIDPNRIWASASDGARVAASIGMVLSGIGAGLTGQPNLAAQIISRTIDRDVEAQRAELGKKETLLSDNVRKYGNMQQAYQATLAQLHSVAMGQVAEATAKASGADAVARGQYLQGQLGLQRANITLQMAQFQQNRALGQALGSGAFAGPEGSQINLEDPRLAPFKDRIVTLPGGGFVLAKVPGEQKETQATLTSLDKLDKSMDALIALNKSNGTTISGSTADDQGTRAKDAATLQLNELFGLKRINDFEGQRYEKMIKHPGSILSDKALAGFVQMKQIIKNMRDSEFQNHVEGYNPGAAAQRTQAAGPVLTGGK